jgi:hypothetical protein
VAGRSRAAPDAGLAEKNWPQLAKVRARYHGSFAYITGVLRDGEQIPLFRLRYGGSAHSFGFAIYSAASDRYQDALLRTGLPTGTPQEALDTACTVHLAGLEPLTLLIHTGRAGAVRLTQKSAPELGQ